MPKRPDLRLIITSATIDAGRFAEHFADRGVGEAPVIEVSGRTYPVEVASSGRWKPTTSGNEPDLQDARAGGGRGSWPASIAATC